MIINRIIVLSFGFALGITFATIWNLNSAYVDYLSLVFIFSGILCCIYTLYGEYKWREYSKFVIYIPLLVAGLAFGIFRTNSVIHSNSPAVLFLDSLKKNELIDVRGKIVAEPELRTSNSLTLRIRINKLKRVSEPDWKDVPPEDVRLSVYKTRSKSQAAIFDKLADSKSYGYDIEFQSSYQPVTEEKNPGGFNMKAFLLAEGCIADFKINNWRLPKNLKGKIEKIDAAKGFFLMEWALAAKRNFISTYKYSILPPASGLISGATLGTRFALRGKKYRGAFIEDFFRHSGVGHVLAVSGLHVSVVCLLLFSLLKFSRIPPKYFAPGLILLLFAFVLLTGARPSSLRASIMNSVIILIFVYCKSGFKKATYAGLATSAFIILIRRPMVLYSPAFLLSFGAVLSLVIISSPIEKILNQLRGAVLIFVLSWYLGVLVFACNLWESFLRWEVLILLVMLLWLFISLGALVNRKMPGLLKFRFDRMPSILRLFLSAQLAIQFGMMIPMSAYFFGRFPIAGMFVNLIAIPLVGILVQLGILIGLAGMIPCLGWVAFIFGAAGWFMGLIFIFSAWMGSVVFPYPPVPKPSVIWMLGYYGILILMLSMQIWFRKIQNLIYKLKFRVPMAFNFGLFGVFLLISGCAIYRYIVPLENKNITVDILSGTYTPVVLITGEREGAIVINSDNSFFADRNLKNIILARGNISVYSAFCSGRAGNDGAEGFAKLSESINLKKVFYPAFSNTTDGIYRIEGDNKKYTGFIDSAGIGSHKKINRSKLRWLNKCAKNYTQLYSDCSDKMIFYSSPGKLKLSSNIDLTVLNRIYETYPVPLMLNVADNLILIVGDPSAASLMSIPKEKLRTDYLIIPLPKSNRLKYYLKGLEYILKDNKIKEIVICVQENSRIESNQEILNKILESCSEFNTRTTLKQNISFSFSK